ncbi:MAG: ribosome small subunit-dependent GTPase A [Thermoanaerobaculia bacterium]
MKLSELGWSEFFDVALAQSRGKGLTPGRVVSEHRGVLRVATEKREWRARPAGRLRREAVGRGDLPAVGDWVLLEAPANADIALVQQVLPRRTKFSRRAAGERNEEQVLAANIDLVWIAASIAGEVNLRSIERYLSIAWESGAQPVVVLTKADLAADAVAAVSAVESISPGIPVVAVSSVSGEGIAALGDLLTPGTSIAILGPSGVGKSSLINRIAGEELMKVGDVREDDQRGRHTTTHRQLLRMPSGALIIDTPGIREIQLWETEEGIEETFSEIEIAARHCRFSDCRHETEPGCGVRDALARGELDTKRVASFRKLQSEIEFQEQKHDPRVRAEAKRRIREIMRAFRKPDKLRDRRK